jgi:hypothetical protein
MPECGVTATVKWGQRCVAATSGKRAAAEGGGVESTDFARILKTAAITPWLDASD